MTNTHTPRQVSKRDLRLLYTLRVAGFAVVLISTFLLMKSITLDPVANNFFGVSAVLGFLILLAGWVPLPTPTGPNPVTQPVTPPQTTTYRPVRPVRSTSTPAFQPAMDRRR